MNLHIGKTSDFELDGHGGANNWKQADWHALERVGGDSQYATRARILYSDTGLYFLVDCKDTRLTCTMTEDFSEIFREDVVEVFLRPDLCRDLYFEYEISPLEVELPIIIPNLDGHFFGWRPWQYEGARRTRKATSVYGGDKTAGAKVDGWTAEFFLPYKLLHPMIDGAPEKGDEWTGNVYRIDYDADEPTHWALSPETGANFHNFHHFGRLIFA